MPFTHFAVSWAAEAIWPVEARSRLSFYRLKEFLKMVDPLLVVFEGQSTIHILGNPYFEKHRLSSVIVVVVVVVVVVVATVVAVAAATICFGVAVVVVIDLVHCHGRVVRAPHGCRSHGDRHHRRHGCCFCVVAEVRFAWMLGL